MRKPAFNLNDDGGVEFHALDVVTAGLQVFDDMAGAATGLQYATFAWQVFQGQLHGVVVVAVADQLVELIKIPFKKNRMIGRWICHK